MGAAESRKVEFDLEQAPPFPLQMRSGQPMHGMVLIAFGKQVAKFREAHAQLDALIDWLRRHTDGAPPPTLRPPPLRAMFHSETDVSEAG